MANVLPMEKQVAAIHALCEGTSIRAIERMTGVHRDTVMRLGVRLLAHAPLCERPCEPDAQPDCGIVTELVTTHPEKITREQFDEKYAVAFAKHRRRLLFEVGDQNPDGANLLGADEIAQEDEPASEDEL